MEENVLTVSHIDEGLIYLHKGILPDTEVPEDEDYKALFVAYWILHPETDPSTPPFTRKYVAVTGMGFPFTMPSEDGKTVVELRALRVIGVFDTFEEWQEFEGEQTADYRREEVRVIEWPQVPAKESDDLTDEELKMLMDEFLASGDLEPYLVVVNKNLDFLWVDRTDRMPWDGQSHEDADPGLETSYEDGTVKAWCLARSARDACRAAYLSCRLELSEDIPGEFPADIADDGSGDIPDDSVK